jgi:hypothetical protein
MIRPLSFRGFTSLGVIGVLLWSWTVGVHAQQCMPAITTSRAALGGHIESGYTQIFYRIRPTSCSIPQEALNSVAMAIGKWNDRPSGIKISLVSCWYTGEVDFQFGATYSQSLSSGCAAVINGETMWLDMNNFVSWAASDYDLAAAIASHEIGHLLGLDDAGVGGWTVMNNPWAASNCYTAAFQHRESGWVAAPTQADAEASTNCIVNAKAGSPVREEPGSDHYYYSGPCYELWVRWLWYSCTTDACVYQSDSWEYIGTYCEEFQACEN